MGDAGCMLATEHLLHLSPIISYFIEWEEGRQGMWLRPGQLTHHIPVAKKFSIQG